MRPDNSISNRSENIIFKTFWSNLCERNHTKIASFCVALLIMFWGSLIDVSAKTFHAKEGVYVGAIAAYNAVDGDFDGDLVLVSFDQILAVPKVSSALGWGITLGYRSDNYALELGYLKSEHDATWAGLQSDVDYTMWNLDYKYFFSEKRTQPFFLVGLALPKLVLKDGSVDSFGNVSDASFNGIGINLGIGLAHYLTEKLSLNGTAIYRLMSYGSASGAAGSQTLVDALGGSALNFNVGVMYTF